MGCKKLVDIDAPRTEILSGALFSSDANAQAAITGAYSQMISPNATFFDDNCTLYNGLLADELYSLSNEQGYQPYLNNQMLTTDGIALNNWQALYKVIYAANNVLSQVASAEALSDAFKKQASGEMRFIRALCYFYLVNTYGPVPLVLSTDYRQTSGLPRSDTALVYQQLISDLLAAKDQLPGNYDFNGGAPNRANKYVAAALLARVYLYQKQYAKAEAEASLVLAQTSLYQLLPSDQIGNVFLQNSQETIFSLSNGTYSGSPANTYTNEGYVFYFFGKYLNATDKLLRPQLIGAFEPGDLRKNAWIDSFTLGNTAYYFPAKYKSSQAFSSLPENYMMLRIAEQYLLRAEARAWQNNLSGAMDDVNTLRARAGVPALTALPQQALLDAIDKEWQLEFFCELGHRWFNLLRTGKVTGVLAAIKGAGWKPSSLLYPIPQTERGRNPLLSQNNGY